MALTCAVLSERVNKKAHFSFFLEKEMFLLH